MDTRVAMYIVVKKDGDKITSIEIAVTIEWVNISVDGKGTATILIGGGL